jgi:hypothetical protein
MNKAKRSSPFRLTPIALAVCVALPAAAQAAPSVSFVSPTSGATISGNLYQSSACEVRGSSISRVVFFLDGTQLNTEGSSPWNCNLDTRKFSDGAHTLRAVAYDSAGASASTQIGVTIKTSTDTGGGTTTPGTGTGGTPYSGTPVALPKSFAAADFDKGGQNVAYRDMTSGNQGGQYRTGEDADIGKTRDAQGGVSPYDIVNFQTGEWLTYTVSVPSAGNYDLELRVANNYATTPAFHIELDGTDVTGRISVPKTGNWTTYQWVGKKGVALPAGTHVLKVVADAQYFSLNGIRAVAGSGTTPTEPTEPPPADTYSGTPFSGTPIAVPKAFAAAEFDKGGQNVAYRDMTSGNQGGQFRTSEDVDIINGGDSATPYSVNYFQKGEWLAYSVSVPADGKYDLAVKAAHNYAGNPAFRMEVDGVDVTGKIAVPKTGSWSSYQWVGKEGVSLKKGKRVVKVFAEDEYFNMAGLSVLATGTSTPTEPTEPAPTEPTGGPTNLAFVAPANGGTISGSISQSSGCELTGTGIARVDFSLDSTPLNTEGSAPWNCNIDTTKFADGTHKLKARAYDSGGRYADKQIDVVVKNGSTAPSDGGGVPADKPGTMLFWSGFEGSIAPGTPFDCYSNGCYQEIKGTDSFTGFTWPPRLSNSSGKFQLLVNGPTPTPTTVYDYMYNEIQTVTGPKGNSTKVLYNHIGQSGCCGTNPQGSHSTQNPYLLFPTSDVKQAYVSYWIKFQPDLAEKLHAGDAWRPVFEFKTSGDDYRMMLSINAYGGQTPYWDVETNTYVPSHKTYWRVNTAGKQTVPGGKWMKIEVFWNRSSGSDGRIWVAADGKVIVDRYGPNMGTNGAPINRIMLTQLYSGSPYPIYQWVDDVQVWSSFPTAKAGDPWYDGVYAPH